MSQETISDLYKRFLNDSLLLQNGKEFLENLLITRKDFIFESLELFLHSNESLQMKRYIGVLIKNLIKDNWETSPILISSQKVVIIFLFKYLFLFFSVHKRNFIERSC